MRLVLEIEYDGSNYHGFQRQRGLLSIQQTLEEALSKIAREPVNVTCAGRTDAGVHALFQVVHFDTQANRKPTAWVLGVNHYLPKDIRVLSVKVVDQNFDARRSAKCRTYRYLIYNYQIPSALYRLRTMWCPYQLNVEQMQLGANYLLGELDFSSFRGSHCESKTPMRRVDKILISRGGNIISIEISANAFLLHMVRNIVGSLVEVGKGKRCPEWIKEVLLAKDRTKGCVTVPACGLYLIKVQY